MNDLFCHEELKIPSEFYFENYEINDSIWESDVISTKKEYHSNGNIRKITKEVYSENYIDSESIHTYFYTTGVIMLQYWIKNGKIHRENGPAFSMYTDNGCKKSDIWMINGKYSRKQNLPVIVEYYININNKIDMQIKKENWITSYWVYDAAFFMISDDGNEQGKTLQPSVISYYINGMVMSKSWSLNGIPYRENNGPVFILYDTLGNILKEEWMIYEEDTCNKIVNEELENIKRMILECKDVL